MIGLALALAVTCARCHPAEAAQAGTAMAHALESVADCAILKAHPQLGFRDGKYSYTIRREGEASIYSVTDGSGTVSALIAWVFGNGAAGQTYVFAQGGAWYESRVSFYNALGGLDLTMGAASLAPASLQEAAGRKMDAANARECFSCHATGAVKGSTLALDALSPGVKCERCHGPTAQHLATLAPMPKLSTLSTEEVSNLCGRCHRTWEDIAANGPRGLVNVRFQPYRLTNSRCYDAADRRIACTACHDPHQPVVRQAANYDAKCQACHAAGSCKVATRNCVACHMPKVELPGAHFAFTDHRIRIARPGERYPN